MIYYRFKYTILDHFIMFTDIQLNFDIPNENN